MFFDPNQQIKKDVSKLIDDKKKLAPQEQIHIIWYCIHHESGRFEDIEQNWIKELEAKGVPVILVLTKSIRGASELKTKLKSEQARGKLPVQDIIPVLAESMSLFDNNTVKAHGLKLLVKATAKILPEVARKAFAKALQSIELKRHAAAKWLIHAYMPSAFAGSFFAPIPLLGSKVSAVALQTAMLAHISSIFELPFNSAVIRMVFCASVGTTSLDFGIEEILKQGHLEEILKQGLNNLTQMIPDLVQQIPAAVPVVGGVIAGSSATASTLIIGLAYIDVLKNYKQAQLEGKEISESELAPMLIEQINYYAQLGWNTLKLLLDGGLTPDALSA